MPSTARPPDSAWTAAIAAAVAAGCRVTGFVTPVASWSRRRGLRREREPDVAVAGQVLRVHQGEAVVAGGLDGRGVARGEPRQPGAGGPDLRHHGPSS